MANENDDVLKANEGGPAADIPNLKKKKEKERKKGGAAWSGGQGAGEFTGAAGGNGARAAASAASAAGGAMGEGAGMLGAEAAAEAAAAAAAEGGGGLFGGLFSGVGRFLASIAESLGMGEVWAAASEFLASLTSTVLGKMIVAAAALMMMAVVGLLGYALMKGGGDAAMGMPDLGGITDSMKIHGSDGDRLGVASNGELNFGSNNANVPAKTEAKAEDAKADDKKAADGDKGDGTNGGAGSGAGFNPQNQLAHNLSGAKLSSSLGGDFGNKNIFAGGNTPKFDISKTGMPKLPAVAKGNLGGAMKGGTRSSAAPRSIGRAKTNRAIGQLRMAKGMSMVGADAANAGNAENAAAAANGAFDQQKVGNGTLNTNTPSVTPPGGSGGGPNPNTNTPGGTNDNLNFNTNTDNTNTNPGCQAGTDPTCTTDNALKNATDQIEKMAAAARQMQQTGMMLLAIGIVILGIGIKLCCNPLTAAFGAVLVGIGAMLMGMGYMMIQTSKQMAQMAKAMGDALSASLGNTPALASSVKDCTDQTMASGTKFADCNNTGSNVAKDRMDNANRVDTPLIQSESNSSVTVDPLK
ncbi:MAG: hypothetical protein ACHQ51_11220 [Elusimicrobiota bacterium]